MNSDFSGRIIDLTLPLRGSSSKFNKEMTKTVNRDGWNASMLHIYSHMGTHIDSPKHFDVSEKTIDEIELENLVVDSHIVRLPDTEPRKLIQVEDLKNLHDIKPGEGILFHTGWSKYSEQEEMYRNNLPRISKELAQWCVDHGIIMIGVEPPSIADVNNKQELTEVHTILLKGGITIVEGLTNLDLIKSSKVKVIALPLKVEKGDGAPARVIAYD